MKISLEINGRAKTATVAARTHLADFVRDDLGLTGTHLGCEHGVCGACTLMVDGRPVRSCLMLAAACDGAKVLTIESFDDDALMQRLRQAFSRHHALQCGYCTPGMLVTAYDIVRRLPDAREDRIREELSGNLCRCTGYMGIVAAISDTLGGSPPSAAVQPIKQATDKSVPEVRDRPEPAFDTRNDAKMPVAVAIDKGSSLQRSIRLSISPDAAWAAFRDIRLVASCLPGTRIDRIDGDDVEGAFTISIGPMKAGFNGHAKVSYDDGTRAGDVSGSGRDPISRSAADGTLRFIVAPDDPSGCIVNITLAYRLKGPLAQFGRTAVVGTVVDSLLSIFATNLVASAQGEKMPPPKLPVVKLLLGMFAAFFKQGRRNRQP